MTNTLVSEESCFVQMDFKPSDNSTSQLSFLPDNIKGFISRKFELFLNKHLKSF